MPALFLAACGAPAPAVEEDTSGDMDRLVATAVSAPLEALPPPTARIVEVVGTATPAARAGVDRAILPTQLGPTGGVTAARTGHTGDEKQNRKKG